MPAGVEAVGDLAKKGLSCLQPWRAGGVPTLRTVPVALIAASLVLVSCSCDSDEFGPNVGSDHAGVAGNAGENGSSDNGNSGGGVGASAGRAGGTALTEGAGTASRAGGAGIAAEVGGAGGSSGASDMGGAAGQSEDWDFCTGEPSEPVEGVDLSVSLNGRVWCTQPYRPNLEDSGSGEDLLAKSLRRAVQARAVAGEYAASSEVTEFLLPWCVRSRNDTATSSALGMLEIRISSSLHDQPISLGSESVVIRSSLGVPTAEAVIRGPGSVLVFFEDGVMDMGHCDQPAGQTRVVRSFEFAEGSVSFETRLASDSSWETTAETWVKAWGEFGGEAFEVRESLNLAAVEMPGSLNIVELGMLLEAPIGDVCGFRSNCTESTAQLSTTDCNLTALRELELIASDVVYDEL